MAHERYIGKHLLLFHSGANVDLGLVVFFDLHNNPDTGYLEVGVVGKQRFDPGGGVASDQFSGFKIPSGDDDLHSLSFLKICFLHSKTAVSTAWNCPAEIMFHGL